MLAQAFGQPQIDSDVFVKLAAGMALFFCKGQQFLLLRSAFPAQCYQLALLLLHHH